MNDSPTLVETAAELRRAFDGSFAAPSEPVSQEVEDLLAIGVAGSPYAIHLRDIAAIVTRRTIVPVPAAAPSLLGVAGIRGDIVPVFGLASLLGYEDAADGPPWLVLCRAEPVALGFADLQGYLRLPRSALLTEKSAAVSDQYVNEIATTNAGVRAVIGISLIVATIRDRLGRERPSKEH